MMVPLLVLAYFVVTAAIGAYMVRSQSSVSEFFVAKRNLSAWLIIPLLFAEMIAGAGTVGNAATAFDIGISSAWVNWGMCIGCIAVMLLAVKYYRVVGTKAGAMSVPEAYLTRFDAKTRMVMLVILVLVYLMLFAMQPVAAAAILSPLLGIDKILITWIMGALFVYLTISGGMRGLAWMNVLHSIVMYIGLGIVCFFAVKAAGGWSGMQATLPPEFFSLGQPDLLTVLGWTIGTALSYFAASTVVAVIFGGNTERDINKGMIGAAILVGIFALFPAVIGMAGKVLLPAAEGRQILYLVADLLGPSFAVIASMGILAAILSTGPAMLLVVITMISRDIFRVFKPDASEKDELKFARIATVVLGAIAIYAGLQATSILNQLVGAFQIRAIAGLVLVVAVFWPRVDSRAAFWSMLLGGLVAAVWHFTGNPYGVTSLWPSLIVGVPILIILTLMAKKPVDEGYTKYQDMLDEATAEGSL